MYVYFNSFKYLNSSTASEPNGFLDSACIFLQQGIHSLLWQSFQKCSALTVPLGIVYVTAIGLGFASRSSTEQFHSFCPMTVLKESEIRNQRPNLFQAKHLFNSYSQSRLQIPFSTWSLLLLGIPCVWEALKIQRLKLENGTLVTVREWYC